MSRVLGLLPGKVNESLLQPNAWEECHQTAVRELAGLLRDRSIDVDRLKTYCSHLSESSLRLLLNKQDYFGLTMLFYAIRRGDPKIVEFCLKNGSEPNTLCRVQVSDRNFFPFVSPLVFAIAGDYDSPTLRLHSTGIVRYLLAYGAAPSAISPKLFTPPDRPTGLDTDSPDELHKFVERKITFSHRYLLDLATRLGKPTLRMRAKMLEYDMEELMRVPFFLIGQEWAIRAVTSNLVTHRMLGAKKPLVLAFAGSVSRLFDTQEAYIFRQAFWTWQDTSGAVFRSIAQSAASFRLDE